MLYRIKYSYETSETVYAGPFVGDRLMRSERFAYVEAPNVSRAVMAVSNFVKESNIREIVVLTEKVYHAT